LRKLTDQEIDKLSSEAASAAQNYIFSQVSSKEVLDLDINIEMVYQDGLDVDVSIELILDDLCKSDSNQVAAEAVELAIATIDEFVKSL
jgi:hypothetical protein